MARGELGSDEILLGMLEDRFSRDDTKGGFILDGYPRNLAQADAPDALLGRIGQPMDYAVQLAVPVDLRVARIADPPQARGPADDSPEPGSTRPRVYHRPTPPVILFYRHPRP